MSGAGFPARLRTALFGIAARRALADYIKVLLLIQFVLLCVGWTIDLAQTFPGLRADAEAQELPVYQLLLPYMGYRAADMLTRMLPMACFFSVFLAEFLRRGRLETVILAAGGASALRMIAPVVIFGLLVGLPLFKLERDWRPRAVAAQVELGHGAYAERFRKVLTPKPHWFVSGDTAIRARIRRDDPPALHEVLIFVGLRPPQMRQIYSAARAEPGPGPGIWILREAELWDIEAGGEAKTPLGDIELALDLIPEQLSYFDVPGFYLPDEPLHAIAAMKSAPHTAADADVAIWRRHLGWAIPGTVALLAMLLGQRGYSGRRANVPRLIALGLAGYMAVISVKVVWSVGELGALPAWAAVSLPPAYILAACAWLMWRQRGPNAARAAAMRG